MTGLIKTFCIFIFVPMMDTVECSEDELFDSIIDAPHAAFLVIYCTEDLRKRGADIHTCSASILNSQILVTAASCIHACRSVDHIIVATKRSFILPFARQKNLPRVISEGFVVHKGYNNTGTDLSNDIALVKVKSLQLGSNKRVAIIKTPPATMRGYVVEFRVLNETGPANEDTVIRVYTRTKEQLLLSDQKCYKMLQNRRADDVICAIDNKNAEFEEYKAKVVSSGSGLLINGYILIGVLSYKQLATLNSPPVSVYTSAAHHYDWIEKATENLCVNGD